MSHPVNRAPDGLTVVVHRRIKPGREAVFEEAMRDFVQFALGCPGHRGISILRPPATGRDYTVVHQFTDESSRRDFKATPEYQQWLTKLAELTEGDARIQELSGLEGWFTLPDQWGLAKPPKYKMALATFLGVFPVALLLNVILGPYIRHWPLVLSGALFNACVVLMLTWIVMPLVTRALHRWLFPHRA